jgi:hypothetical protein
MAISNGPGFLNNTAYLIVFLNQLAVHDHDISMLKLDSESIWLMPFAFERWSS